MDFGIVFISFATGMLVGFIIGYVLRRILWIILAIVGMLIAGLVILVYNNIAAVDFATLVRLLLDLLVFGAKTGNWFVDKVFSGLPLTTGFISGFVLGLLMPGGFSRILYLGREYKRRVLRYA